MTAGLGQGPGKENCGVCISSDFVGRSPIEGRSWQWLIPVLTSRLSEMMGILSALSSVVATSHMWQRRT